MSKSPIREHQWFHKERFMLIILRVITSLVFLAGGIVLLAMRLPGWGIILGLPMVIFGSVFIIFTYDEVLSRTLEEPHKSSNKPPEYGSE